MTETNRGDNKNRMKKELLIGISVAATILVATMAITLSGTNSSDAVNIPVCMTPDKFASALKFEVRKPATLPQGYTLQCERAELFQAYMIYAPRTLTTTDPMATVARDNAVLIIVDDETMNGAVQPLPPEERIIADTNRIPPERMQEMGARYLTINGYPAWVREAGDYGTDTIMHSNGTVISIEKYRAPARLHINIGNIDYTIEADRPSEELIKIAESLK